MRKLKRWLVDSNRAFDRLDWWKLFILMIYIIVVNTIDQRCFDGDFYTFAITGVLFVSWRMFGMMLAQIEVDLEKRFNDLCDRHWEVIKNNGVYTSKEEYKEWMVKIIDLVGFNEVEKVANRTIKNKWKI